MTVVLDKINHANKVWNAIRSVPYSVYTVCTPVPVHKKQYYDYFARTISKAQMGLDHKPPGTWYSFGCAWVDFLHCQYKEWHRPWVLERLSTYKYIYRIRVDRKKIFILRSYNDIRQFTKEFGLFSSKWYHAEKIDWQRVAKLTDGIEIKFNEKADDKSLWYSTWDCSSGVVWNGLAIKKVKLICKI